MGTDGERAALVSEHNMYTEEGGRGEELPPPPAEKVADPTNILGQFHQDALTLVGLGRYHFLLGLAAGFCFMVDGVQVFILPYIIPSIQAEMCLEDDKVFWINGVTMIGLIVGSFLCSIGDHIGRKNILLHALIIHYILNIGAAFPPNFDVFLISRLGSSIGLGMCYPAACIYFAEFLPQNSRGKLSILLLFWALGGFYVVFLAYNFLPSSGLELINQLEDHNNNWRRVLFASSLPTIFAIIFLCFTSESVRYLLYKGNDLSAITIYQQMYELNASGSDQYQLSELEVPRKAVSTKPPPSKSVRKRIIYNIREYFNTFKHFGARQNLIPLVLLSVTWAALGFSYYGMSRWVPQHLQNLKNSDYDSQVIVIHNKHEFQKEYNSGLYDHLFENVTFEACLFSSTISHVVFRNCIFNNSDFAGIHSSKTYFINSIIENTRFYDTDFTKDRFVNTQLINISDYSTKVPCRNDLDFRIKQSDKIHENILRLITPFIALTVNCVYLFIYAKNKIGVASVLLCGLMSVAYWFLDEEVPILVLDFIWSILFLIAFNSVNIITVEAFPVHLRATGFGICFACFRIFGLLSSSFTVLIIPITIILLLFGGISLFRLQDSSFNLL